MDLRESLHDLAMLNVYGISFLVAYGTTWVICGLLWLRVTPRLAALCTLFQGMVALPAALGLSFAIGALGNDRPVDEAITELSIYIAMSQLLGLPVLVYLYIREHYALVPYVFAAVCSMHFMLYSWLYQTPVYVAMAVVISVGATVVMLAGGKTTRERLAARTSFLTGAAMIGTVVVLLGVYVTVRG